MQPCFVERHFRFSLLLMDPEYFGVSRRKKKCYYRLWVWVSTGPSMNTINQLAIPFSLFYARQLYRILRSVIWGGGGGNQLEEFQPRSPNIFLPLCRRRNMKYRFSTLRNSLSLSLRINPFSNHFWNQRRNEFYRWYKSIELYETKYDSPQRRKYLQQFRKEDISPQKMC